MNLDSITLAQLLVGIVAAVIVCVVISSLLFALDAIFTGPTEQSCVIHPDRWGLYCSAHQTRVAAFDACPHRRSEGT